MNSSSEFFISCIILISARISICFLLIIFVFVYILILFIHCFPVFCSCFSLAFCAYLRHILKSWFSSSDFRVFLETDSVNLFWSLNALYASVSLYALWFVCVCVCVCVLEVRHLTIIMWETLEIRFFPFPWLFFF